MPKTKKISKNVFILWQVITAVLFVVAIAAAALYVLSMSPGDHDSKVNAYGDDSLQVVTGEHSIVVNAAKAPAGLVSFLKKDDGCLTHNATYIISGADANFARLQYGCSTSTGFAFTIMDAKNTRGTWSFISPTDMFFGGIPLCSYLEKNKIYSHSVEPLCVNGDKPTNEAKPYSFDLRFNSVKE